MARADGEALRHSVRGLVERPAGDTQVGRIFGGPALVEPERLQSVLVRAEPSRLTRLYYPYKRGHGATSMRAADDASENQNSRFALKSSREVAD